MVSLEQSKSLWCGRNDTNSFLFSCFSVFSSIFHLGELFQSLKNKFVSHIFSSGSCLSIGNEWYSLLGDAESFSFG